MDTLNELNATSLDAIAELAKKKIKTEREQETLLVTRNQINQMCGLTNNSATVRNWTNDPTFPKPIPHSGVTRWFKADVIAWLRGDYVSA